MTEEPLRQSMERAVRHYASLFKLPSYKKIVLLQALACMGGGLCSTVILLRLPDGLFYGLVLGILLFAVGFISDYVSKMLLLRLDPIYDLRRTAAVSLCGWGLWFTFILAGAIVSLSSGFSWWVRLCLLGFSAVLILRSIVYKALASVNTPKVLLMIFLHPFFCLVPFLDLWARTGYVLTVNLLAFLIVSPFVSLVATYVFLSLLNRLGEQALGIPSLSLFRAFLQNWLEDLNVPFEEFLESLSEEQDVEVSLIKFDSSKPKAAIIVPSVHPGPFKNIGSSLLPSLIKTNLESKRNYITCVPLGMQGHELDLASRLQNQRVIDRVVEAIDSEASESKATPFIKVDSGLATACCQIFGDSALLSFTLAPNTTEDLPQELGMFVRQESEKHSLDCCVVANAHNCIDGIAQVPEALDALKDASVTCLKKAIALKRLPFEVGASTVVPQEFSLREGMGAGGITVIVVKVGDQKTAYVVVDGNNLVAGLRERILAALKAIGVDQGEVFTTDTHSVSALILGGRGYHPVGEVISHDRLIHHIREATLAALSDLEYVKVACRIVTVPKVKVIGEERLKAFSLLIDEALKQAKKIAVPIFAVSGLFLMLFLLFV